MDILCKVGLPGIDWRGHAQGLGVACCLLGAGYWAPGPNNWLCNVECSVSCGQSLIA